MSSLKILIVDDFELFRQLLRDALADLNYTNVVEAEDGADAQEKLLSADIDGKPFELVFCDWMMPGMSGMELLTFCRNYRNFKTIPFVMVTAESDRGDVVNAIRAGATEYIVKPISREDLAKKIPKIFQRVLKSQKLG